MFCQICGDAGRGVKSSARARATAPPECWTKVDVGCVFKLGGRSEGGESVGGKERGWKELPCRQGISAKGKLAA